jgi:hypothetical protein
MQANGDGQHMGPPRPMTPADTEMNGADGEGDGEFTNGQAQAPQPQPQAASQAQPMISESARDDAEGPAAL